MGNRVWKACRAIIDGEKLLGGFLDEVVYHSLFMGGVNLYVNYNGKIILVDTEYVDTASLAFYYRVRQVSIAGFKSTSIGDWVLLMTGLRTGDMGLVNTACKNIGEVIGERCRLNSGSIELIIQDKRKPEPEGYSRLFIDNNGLRNVVAVD